MIMKTVTKVFEFDYAHYLPDYPGKCRNLHGHRGILEVEVSGLPYMNTSRNKFTNYPGMIVDFGDLKKIVEENIIDVLDHQFLNEVKGLEVPTAENMASWMWKALQEFFQENLVRVRVYETSTSFAEIKRMICYSDCILKERDRRMDE